MRSCDYHRPGTLAEAMALKASLAPSRFVAGGTDLMVQLKDGRKPPCALVSLRHLRELGGVDFSEQGARIGAAATMAEVVAHPELARQWPVLADALSHMGSVQIRNSATVGGNLCNASPCADSAPPLLVHEAKVRITGPEGERSMPLMSFFTGPGTTALGPDDVLVEVLLDPPPEGARAVFFKKRRVAMDLALVSVAVLLVLDGDQCTHARVAAGSVAPIPVRLSAVEAALEGQRLTPEVIAAAREASTKDILPMTDLRATEDYRRHLVGVYVQRGVQALLGGAP